MIDPPPSAGRLLAVVLLATLACCRASETPREAPVSAASASPPVSQVTQADSPAPAPAAPAVPEAGIPLGERLAREARSRPARAIRMEELLAALEERGVAAARTRQVLGSTWGARYCAIAQTESGLGLATCEFETPDAARAGMALSRERFDRLMPGRETRLNGRTLLTIAPRDPALDEEARTVTAIFAGLVAP